MNASTIAEGIFTGAVYVFLGYVALKVAIGVCIAVYKSRHPRRTTGLEWLFPKDK